MAQFNPVFYGESALLQKTETWNVFQGEAAWSHLLFVNIFTLPPPAETAQEQDSHLKRL